LWVLTPCSIAACKAAKASKTSVSCHNTTWNQNPEDLNLSTIFAILTIVLIDCEKVMYLDTKKSGINDIMELLFTI
jgi:hypothetical protein